MNKLKILNGTLAVVIGLPIWFYILYQVLSAVQATELTWFLYWVYVPVGIVVTFFSRDWGE